MTLQQEEAKEMSKGQSMWGLLGCDKEFVFYSVYEWMLLKSFRQKTDEIWILILKDHSKSYVGKRQ
jgi:hypothetical protein